MSEQLKVTLIRGLSGRTQPQRQAVNGLGLRRVNHTVILKDNASVRGLIRKVDHMLKVEKVKE